MTETEKLQRTIAEFESEVAGLTADVAHLEQQLVIATTTAEQAIAAAERRADDATQAAAVDAEQERQRLATSLTRKRLALAAAASDLAAARHGLEAAQAAAQVIRLGALVDEIAVAAGAIDDTPTDPALWGELKRLTSHAQSIYQQCGGRSTFIDDPAAIRARLWGAHAVVVDWAIGQRNQAPAEIPKMATLLGLPRAAGLVRELMTA